MISISPSVYYADNNHLMVVSALTPQICELRLANCMMLSPLDQWLEREGVKRWDVLEEHTQVLKSCLDDTISLGDATKELVDTAASSSDPSDTAYRLWNLLFHAAAALPAYIDQIVHLTLAVRNVHPSPGSPNKLSYTIWSHWQDTHSYYYTWRTLRPFSSPDSLTSAEQWTNFITFSAKLVQHGDEMVMRQIGITAFFDMRDALETTLETRTRDLPHNAVVTPSQSLETDIVAAAQWVRHAGFKLLQLHNAFFGEGWIKGLSKKTEFWDGAPGFSQARWKFWAERFEERAIGDQTSKDARKAAREATLVIRANLGERT
jgi:hypothetical protein